MISPTMENFMAATIESWRSLEENAQLDLSKLLIEYITKQITFAALRKEAKRHLKPNEIVKLRANMVSSFDINAALKMSIITSMHTKAAPTFIFRRNGLKGEDANILDFLREEGIYHNIKKSTRDLPEKFFTAGTIASSCEKDMLKLHPLVKNLAYRKLRFLFTTYGEDFSDLVSDMQIKGTQVYFHVAPYLFGLHRYNFVMHSIFTECSRIIYFHRRQKRDRFDADGNVKQFTMFDGDRGEKDEDGLEEFQGSVFSSVHTKVIEAESGFRVYFSSLTPYKKELVKLILLEPNDAFMQYAKYIKATRAATPVDFCRNAGKERYLDTIVKYFNSNEIGLTRPSLLRLIDDVRSTGIVDILFPSH